MYAFDHSHILSQHETRLERTRLEVGLDVWTLKQHRDKAFQNRDVFMTPFKWLLCSLRLSFSLP